MYSFLIGENPPTSFNECSVYPKIDSSSFIGPFSSVIGDVEIARRVFVSSNVSIRADEGTPFYIGNKSNIQESCVLHGVKDKFVNVNGKEYSIYIGDRVSIAHGCTIHGPVKICDNVFVGFNCVVFNCIVGKGCYIDMGAKITGGINIPPLRYVPVGAVIDTQKKANKLKVVTPENEEFAKDVIKVNNKFADTYLKSYGDTNIYNFSCKYCEDSIIVEQDKR